MKSSQECVVCLESVSKLRESSSETCFSSGAERCLNEHLRTIFLLRNLLHFPREECEALLQEDGDRVVHYGNPGDWCSLCEVCAELVREAFEVHQEISRLVAQMTRLEVRLKTKLGQSLEKEVEQLGDRKVKVETAVECYTHHRIRSYFRENLPLLHAARYEVGDDVTTGDVEAAPPAEVVDFKHLPCYSGDDLSVGSSVGRPNRRRKRSTKFLPATSTSESGSEDDDIFKPPKKKKRTQKMQTGKKRGRPRKVGGIPRIYRCDKCDFSSRCRVTVHTHKKRHYLDTYFHTINSVDIDTKNSSVDTTKVGCNLCEALVTPRQRYSHLKEKHPSEISGRMALCHLCEMSFANEVNLKNHILVVHEKTRSFTCVTCGAGFSRKVRLREHIQREHSVEKRRIVCEHCGSEHSSIDSLKGHLSRIHYNSEKLAETKRQRQCKHCEQVCMHDADLKLHIRRCHEDLYRFKCDQCDASYMHGAGLETHKNSKHSEENVQCPYCPVQVKCKAYLVAHLRLYCKKKPTS